MNFIDLFAGAGGLSEGFIQAGYTPIAHIEMDKAACFTLKTRTAFHWLNANGMLPVYNRYIKGEITRDELYNAVPKEILDSVLNYEMSEENLHEIYNKIDSILKGKQVDVIIGGPPCQAYSVIGRANSRKMKISMDKDPRNYLYKLYIRFLQRYHPKFFVFENVPGILSAQKGQVWNNITKDLNGIGYNIHAKITNARNFLVLQNRKRMIILGTKDFHLVPKYVNNSDTFIVDDVLSDLPKESEEQYYTKDINCYLKLTKIRQDNDILTQHDFRHTSEKNKKIYKIAIELKNNGYRLNYNDLPKELKTTQNRSAFHNRYTVVGRNDSYCHTIIANNNGNYYIHPDASQLRSITVRESARIQSFPDNFYFEGGMTSKFRQIGNAVPPLLARGIANQIKML